VRHVRMLGLCLAAVCACALVAASSALAKEPTKSPKIFKNCPVNGFGEGRLEPRPQEDCVYGQTTPKAGGQFTVGPITTPLTSSIRLQYGLAFGSEQEEIEKEEKGEGSEQLLFYVPPQNGAEAITPAPQKVPGEPIAHITPAEQEELGWPESLKYSYAHAKKGALKTVYETIEGAGGTPYTSINRILNAEGTGVEVDVKVKGENKWLSQLGDVCYIGSEAEPIVQRLTSGPSTSPLTGETIEGTRGELSFVYDKQTGGIGMAVLYGAKLVDNTYAVPGASCTGPYASVIAATIDKEFSVPQPAGASVTEIVGSLYTGTKAFGESGGA
jgi:hypothetical protein